MSHWYRHERRPEHAEDERQYLRERNLAMRAHLRTLDRGQTQLLSGALVAVLYLLSYTLHAAVSGNFSLPPAVLTWLLPLAPPMFVVIDYFAHGLLTGDWSFPWQPAAGPVQPPAPPVPPST